MADLVIVGGGFAGVWAALAASSVRRRARNPTLTIRVVNRDPALTIRPRLYEPSLEDTRVPLDDVLAPAGVELVPGEVTRIDRTEHRVAIRADGDTRVLAYDRLILAAGSHLHIPAIPGRDLASSVDTYAAAAALARHLASLGTRPTSRGERTVVVVGAGFTGIEVATTLVPRLHRITPRARVVVIERAATVAPDLGPDARAHVERAFATLEIETRTGTSVSEVHPTGVALDNGDWIPAATTIWTGGFRADALAAQLGVPPDDDGRVAVDESLQVTNVDGVFAAGDVARAIADRNADQVYVAPMSCQCAIPMGEIAGYNAAADLLGLPRRRFAHTDYVTCLDLGPAGALFMEGWTRTVRLTGLWGKIMKETINTRLIYPPRRAATPGRDVRPAA
jgi:NADH:quinone reductase (non-electrogenic)